MQSKMSRPCFFHRWCVFLVVLVVFLGKVASDCLPSIPLVLDDMHDGDQKVIKSKSWNTFSLKPYPNSTQWEIEGTFDINCEALINFNVPGKPNPPPVPLKMAMWVLQSDDMATAVKLGFEFTDPSEVIAPRTQPLNIWVSAALSDAGALPPKVEKVQLRLKHEQDQKEKEKGQSSSCLYTPHKQAIVFNDIKVSDMKAITDTNDAITIKPYDNNETWAIDSTFNDGCVAMIDFSVPGYPNPPSTPLVASVWGMASIAGNTKDGILFTKPSASPPIGAPDNVWLPGN